MDCRRAASSEGSTGRTAPPERVAAVKMQEERNTDIQDMEIGAVTHFRYLDNLVAARTIICGHMQCCITTDTAMASVCSI